MDQIKHGLKGGKKIKKNAYYDLFAGEIIRKYKLKKMYTAGIWYLHKSMKKAEKRLFVETTWRESEVYFSERDDVLRCIPGQKSTVTRRK